MIPLNDSKVGGSRGGRVVVVVVVVAVVLGASVVIDAGRAEADAVVSKALVRVNGTVRVGPVRSVAVEAHADTAISTKTRARDPALRCVAVATGNPLARDCM